MKNRGEENHSTVHVSAMAKTVGDVMKGEVATAAIDDPVSEVLQVMRKHDADSVVVTEGDHIRGVITERDLVRRVLCERADPKKIKAGDIMTAGVQTVTPKTPLTDAVTLLDDGGAGSLPVVEDGKVVGVAKDADIYHTILDDLPAAEAGGRKPAAEGCFRYRLKPGLTYLIKEDKPVKSFEIFADAVKCGVDGLCFTRMNPKKLRSTYDLENTPVFWLTNASTEHKSIPPSGFTELSLLVHKLLQDVKRCVIILDGIEYLATNTNYKQTLRLIQSLRDSVVDTNSHLIIPVCHGAWDSRELKLLEAEMDVVVDDIDEIKEKVHEMEK